MAPVVGFLVGVPRQGRVGVGWATMARAGEAGRRSETPSLTVADLDRAIDEVEAATGPGSAGVRGRVLAQLFARATDPEATFVFRLFTGEMRQGALEGVMAEAVAKAAGVPAAVVRRALMLSGDLGTAARVALRGRTGRAGGDRPPAAATAGADAGLAGRLGGDGAGRGGR